MYNGCPTCKCLDVKPCECGPKPNVTARLCPDGKTTRNVTDKCAVSDDGRSCRWVEIKCPIGIRITIKNGTLSDADVALVLAIICDAGSKDITIRKSNSTGNNTGNSTGDVNFDIYVQQDLLSENKTASQFNEDVQEELSNFGTGAQVTVIDDGSGVATDTTVSTGTVTSTATATATASASASATSSSTTQATSTKSDAKLVICSLLFAFLMLFI
jgi:hypothetical protein